MRNQREAQKTTNTPEASFAFINFLLARLAPLFEEYLSLCELALLAGPKCLHVIAQLFSASYSERWRDASTPFVYPDLQRYCNDVEEKSR